MKYIAALALTGALALAASPAIADSPNASEKGAQHQSAKPGPKATTKAKAKAYGKFCQDQSKKKAEGQKKSDFAKCVNAMAKAAKSEQTTAREACKALSKKHVKGEKGTPFSRCRVGVAQMRKEESDS